MTPPRYFPRHRAAPHYAAPHCSALPLPASRPNLVSLTPQTKFFVCAPPPRLISALPRLHPLVLCFLFLFVLILTTLFHYTSTGSTLVVQPKVTYISGQSGKYISIGRAVNRRGFIHPIRNSIGRFDRRQNREMETFFFFDLMLARLFPVVFVPPAPHRG